MAHVAHRRHEEGLLAAMERFNANASEGVDPDFGRGQDHFGQNYQRVDLEKDGAFRTPVPLTQPPFWAANVLIGVFDALLAVLPPPVVDLLSNPALVPLP